MTLAGNMKLKNFVMLGAVVAVAGIGGAYMACSGKHEEKKPDAPVAKPAAPAPVVVDAAMAAAPVPSPPPPPPTTPTSDLAARPYDAEALAWKGRSISGDKVKDASHGKPYKLNVYKDAGSPSVDRVKIDLDRDEKWDEKITFAKDGTVTLERAPADDEKYTLVYHWNGTGWTKVASPAEKPEKK